jgi:hypothetical protein
MISRSRIPTPELVAIAQLVRDEAIQPRIDTDAATVLEYREAMREDAIFPPIDAVRTPDGELLLVDGWHRVEAAEREGLVNLHVRVWTGTREDAVEFAARCNIRHGLRRRAEDLAKAVTILRALPKWRQESAVVIARHVGVSHATVSRILAAKPQLATVVYPSQREKDADKSLMQKEATSDERADRPEPEPTRIIVKRGDQEYPMTPPRPATPMTEPRPRAKPDRNAGGVMMDIRTFAKNLKGAELAKLIEEWVGRTEVSLTLASNPAFLQRLGNNAVVAAWNSMMAWLNDYKRTVSERAMFVKAGLKSMPDEDRRKLIEEIASGAGLKAKLNPAIDNEPYQYVNEEDSLDRIAFHYSKISAASRRSLKLSWSWQRDDEPPPLDVNPFVEEER